MSDATDKTIIERCKAAGVDAKRLKRALDYNDNWGKMVHAFEFLTVCGAVLAVMEAPRFEVVAVSEKVDGEVWITRMNETPLAEAQADEMASRFTKHEGRTISVRPITATNWCWCGAGKIAIKDNKTRCRVCGLGGEK